MQFVVTGLMAFFVLTGGATQATAPAPVFKTHTVSMTGYNAVPGQTDEDPNTTASGAFSNPEVVAARSRDLASQLPFGTVVVVLSAPSQNGCGLGLVKETIGYRVIADTMNARITNTVDILFDNNEAIFHGGKILNVARVFGHCEEVTIRVVGKVNINTMPTSQRALAALFETAELAAN